MEVATAEYAATATRLLRDSFTPHAGGAPGEGLVVISAVYSRVFEARESALLRATGAGELGAFFADLKRLAASVDEGDVAALMRLELQAIRRSIAGATRFRWPLLHWLVVDWVFHVIRTTASGQVTVWKDGGDTPVFEYSGQTKFPDGSGQQIKFGIYKWSWNNGKTQVGERIIHFDELRISETGGRESVSPRTLTSNQGCCLSALIRPSCARLAERRSE